MTILSHQDYGYPTVQLVEIQHRRDVYMVYNMTKRSFYALEKFINKGWIGRAWNIIKKNGGELVGKI